MMIFGGVGAGGPDWNGGSGGQEGQWHGATWDRKLGSGVQDGRGGRGWQRAGGPDGRVVG